MMTSAGGGAGGGIFTFHYSPFTCIRFPLHDFYSFSHRYKIIVPAEPFNLF